MGLILLEALLALVILVGIVWWTMFSGRNKGELPSGESKSTSATSDEPKK
jgi:cytoskeletal protein RodZ